MGAAQGESVDDADSVRLSITISKYIRRQIRIAAAYKDMEISDWCAKVLKREAEKITGAARGQA
jgi:hypothetical protein